MGRLIATTDWLTRGLHKADDDDGDGDGSGGDQGGDGGGNAGNDGDGGKGGKSGDDGGDAKVTMTQSDLDSSFADRARRGGTAALADAAKAAGFNSIEDMTAAAKATTDRDEADKSDLDKATEKLAATEAKLKDADTVLEGTQIANALATAAAAQGIPSDRINDAVRLTDIDGVTVADGQVTGADEAVKALLADKPYFAEEGRQQVNGGSGSGADGGSRGGGNGGKSVDQQTIDVGRALGVTDPESIAQAAAAVPQTPSNGVYVDQVIGRINARNERLAKARQA